MVSEEVDKARKRILQFLEAHPRLSRLRFARTAGVHRNTIYADPTQWSVETLDKLTRAMSAIAAEEARAQRKSRPSRVAA